VTLSMKFCRDMVVLSPFALDRGSQSVTICVTSKIEVRGWVRDALRTLTIGC